MNTLDSMAKQYKSNDGDNGRIGGTCGLAILAGFVLAFVIDRARK
jgi:hypothetical protein